MCHLLLFQATEITLDVRLFEKQIYKVNYHSAMIAEKGEVQFHLKVPVGLSLSRMMLQSLNLLAIVIAANDSKKCSSSFEWNFALAISVIH